ncbi:MAG: Zinc carboxypeptidase [Verrucomicrobiaceae bacterium]|nr:Zinc carboxypeptidase [Verrucomicrobiaceae bacterium]
MNKLLVLSLLCLLTVSGRAELHVETHFEGGNAQVVSLDQSTRTLRIMPQLHEKRGWPCWWYFKLEGLTLGETVTLQVQAQTRPYREKMVLAPEWCQPKHAWMSVDGASWKPTSSPGTILADKSIAYEIKAEAGAMWFAWGPPFVPTMAERLLADIAALLPEANRFDLATTRGGHTVQGIRIGAENAVHQVWVGARQHAWEAGGSWVGNGFVRWFASDDPEAVAMRKTTCLHFIPIMDVDNVAIGAGGKESIPRDHNRDWADEPVHPEVAAAQRMIRDIHAKHGLDVFIDLHNPAPGDPIFFYGPFAFDRMGGIQQRNYKQWMELATVHITGPIKLEPKYRIATFVSTEEERHRMSPVWTGDHTGPSTIAVTLETGWNSKLMGVEGYAQVGASLGRTLAAYLKTEPRRGASSAATEPTTKTEHFDKNPAWEGHNNRIVPKTVLTVKQDFGYSLTNHAGTAKGEIGGAIQRSTTPASYAAPLKPAKTLDDKFSASGTFAITNSQGGAGVFFGFFNSQQPGGSGRPIGSLGLDFDFEGSGGRLAARLITRGNKSCGTFITPYLPGKFRPTPIKIDGTRYHWTLAYDAQAAEGNGRFTFTLTSDTHKTQDYGKLKDAASEQEARDRFPNTTTFIVDLTPGFRKEGATFDRFGMLNMMKSGGTATMFFDDLDCDGRAEDFSKEPAWIGNGNRVTFEDREVVGAHNFGFSEATNLAGGKSGEVGGGLWRSGDFGYYADRVGQLNLDQRLEAHGKVRLVTAGPDSDMSIGWFNSNTKDTESADARNFVGIHVGGPTRVGHYFIPQFATSKSVGKVDKGPLLIPGKMFEWSLLYDPEANDGKGEMRATLGDESVTLALQPGQKAQGATMDRFGLFTSTSGGQMVKIYFDDLAYSIR